MLKSTILVVGFWLVAMVSFAQRVVPQTISGVVKTTDGHPAQYISATLKGTIYGAAANAKGEFEFRAPAGAYTLVVYSIQAHKKEFPVVIKAGQSNHFPDIEVIEDRKQLDAVVVTGQFAPQSLHKSVYKVRVIDKEQIQAKGATNVESLLNTEIGIRLSNDMALGETDIELMGMSGSNIKVLVDGIPIIDRSDKKQSLTQIDINTIDRIEIVEGPMSVMYGTDALAGVINIITKAGQSDGSKLSIGARLHEESIGGEYGFMRGDGSHLQSANAQYSFDNGMYVSGSFSHNEFGGWQGTKTNRAKEWPSKEQISTGWQVGIKRDSYNVAYKFDYLDEVILKKGDVPINKRAKDEEFFADRYTHQLLAGWQPNNRWNLSFAGSYQDYQRDKRSTIIDFTTGEKYPSTEEGAQDDTKYTMLFSRLTASWRATSKLSLLGGAEYTGSDGTGDKVREDVDPQIHNGAVFLSAEYSPLSWLAIRPGVRSTFNSKYNAPLATPSLNVKVKINQSMDLRLSYGRGFRSPTLQELYYELYHTNGGGFWIKGNPDLKAESSDSYMASYTWRAIHRGDMRLTSALSGYLNEYRNRIQRLQMEGTADMIYYNTGKYRTMGLSFENTLVWRRLQASLNVSYIGRYNPYQDDENYADRKQDKMRYSPELAANVTYDWSKVAKFNIFYKLTGKRHEYFVSNDQLILGGQESYSWADFTVSRPIVKHLNISAGVKNIFNITHVDRTAESGGGHGATLSQSIIGSGRSYFVGMSFNFGS